MALKLVKTTGGSNGAPAKCGRCDSVHFQRSAIAWHCTACGTYHPTQLGFNTLKEHFEHADRLMKEFRRSVDDLERLVRE